ncbi:hypothetical protein [Micromonospora pisi]|uniref:hypothetical protein n=1 Tax=Micromonospora pisi TaxID=589240 RepID=UPI000EB2CF54|nr:hypothetical protein [Micromonospora pisi]
MTDAETSLSHLRAAIAYELRLKGAAQLGPSGLTILTPPSDRELIDEVRRLRKLADQAGGTR